MAADEPVPKPAPTLRCHWGFSKPAGPLGALASGLLASAALSLVALAADSQPPPRWSEWFAKNTVVTDKKAYVHFFWNANDVRDRFEGKDKDALLAEAARQLVALAFPKDAAADAVRVDIVFVAERDEYGMPKWDTLRRVAHLEFSRKKLSETPRRAGEPRLGFDVFEVFS